MSSNVRAPASRFPAGTRTPSSRMCACHTPRLLIFPSMTCASQPTASCGASTTNPPTSPSSSRAHTTARSHTDPLPIHRLAPSSTQWSPSRRAVVSRLTTSDPWVGSVSATAPSSSSRAIAGSQRSRCSSDPSRCTDVIASPECTALSVATDPSPRASSAHIIPSASGETPAHPYPSIEAPATRVAAYPPSSSRGNRAASQNSAARGTTSSSHHRRTPSRSSRSRSVSSSSRP